MAPAAALEPAEAQRLLEQADRIKMRQPAEFDALLDRVTEERDALPAPQRDYLRYLQGYQASYLGKYDEAVPLLESVERETPDPTLKFRAAATIANVYIISTRYELAYAQLRPLLDALPHVSDPAARQQGMAVAAYLYNQVGEYGLALGYADRIIEENWGNGACRGTQLRVEALVRSGTAEPDDPEFQSGAERCIAAGEPLIETAIRTHYARLLLDRGRVDEAIAVLDKDYDAAMKSRYPRVIGEFNAILAQAYLRKGDLPRARQHALATIEHGVRDQPTEPLARAYRTLYEVARATGDQRAALSYHEKFAAADKGYLDDLGARQLAYDRVKHESEQERLRADGAQKQSQVAKLQQALAEEKARSKRLYVVVALALLAFVVFQLYQRRRASSAATR
jgi:tetratricopeptide (TPR) repeat protein